MCSVEEASHARRSVLRVVSRKPIRPDIHWPQEARVLLEMRLRPAGVEGSVSGVWDRVFKIEMLD